MVDARFHAAIAPAKLAWLLGSLELAAPINDARAAELLIHGAAELPTAGPLHISLAAHKSYGEALQDTGAGAVVVSPALRELVPPGTVPIVTDSPHDLFAELLDLLYPANTRAVLESGAITGGAPPIIEPGVKVGPGAVIGPGAEIGSGTVIGANTVIGAFVAIGRNCTIAANCTVDCAYLGNNVVLHPGVRVGTEGFGWRGFGKTNRKIPQLGRVVIQDFVEIGANSTIDRGALGDTVIGEGTKIDNLVQVGHNCRIGRYCLIAGQAGLAGSSVLGDGVLIGGAVGVSGHLTIGDGSFVEGASVVSKSWPAGSKLVGYPAQDIRQYWREQATLRRLAKKDRR